MPPRARAAAHAAANESSEDDEDELPDPVDRSRSGRAAAAAAVHADVEPRKPLSDDEIMACLSYKILCQFKTPKDIRISVKGEYWERLPELRGKRLEGTIVQWGEKKFPDMRLIVLWEDGQDTEHVDMLFHPEVELEFLANNETPTEHYDQMQAPQHTPPTPWRRYP